MNFTRLFYGGEQCFAWKVVVGVILKETGAESRLFCGLGNSRWHDMVFIITMVTLSLQVQRNTYISSSILRYMAGEAITIKVTPGVKHRLDKLRRFPRESYNEIISRLTMEAEEEGITEEDIRDIEEALEDIKAGRVYSTAQLKEKLGLD